LKNPTAAEDQLLRSTTVLAQPLETTAHFTMQLGRLIDKSSRLGAVFFDSGRTQRRTALATGSAVNDGIS
jgi:hypothetical protein